MIPASSREIQIECSTWNTNASLGARSKPFLLFERVRAVGKHVDDRVISQQIPEMFHVEHKTHFAQQVYIALKSE
jgi:hypothetical protein